MYGGKQLVMNLFDGSHGFQRVIGLGERSPRRNPVGNQGWHAPELDVSGLLAEPGLERGLEDVAARAPVEEELDHLDFLAARRGLSGFQQRIILAGDDLGDN